MRILFCKQYSTTESAQANLTLPNRPVTHRKASASVCSISSTAAICSEAESNRARQASTPLSCSAVASRPCSTCSNLQVDR